MNTSATLDIQAPEKATSSLDPFRRQVLAYYVNILYGCHQRGEPMTYVFPLILTGLVFDPPQLQPHLRTQLATKLAIEDDTRLRFTYVRIVRIKNKRNVSNEIETLLKIGVTLITR